jgi:SWI/SNF-related matrix-associated actin-dependent regulator of chromatin subfamily A member 5
MFDGVEPEGAD